MKLNEKTKNMLAAGLAVLFVVSVAYNLSRDPRSIYEPGESPRSELLEQQRRRTNPVRGIGEESLLKINILDSSAVKYHSERGRNIFSLAAPPEPAVKPKTTAVAETAVPAVQEPRIPEKPFLYVGFAQSDNKNFAVLLDKNTSKMFIAYTGVNLGNGYIVKLVDRKKVMLFDSNSNQEVELTITE
jgi:hypothetical protein